MRTRTFTDGTAMTTPLVALLLCLLCALSPDAANALTVEGDW